MNTILFDLDGTVLPMDTDAFIKIYFHEMGKAFHDIIEPDRLVKYVWKATDAMVNNTDYRTNEDVFMETYRGLIEGHDLEEHKKRFNAYYDQGYLKVQASTTMNEWMKKSVELLKEKGYEVVIATNPIFPLVGVEHRIRWAGFEPSDFAYISHYEKNHYCKPQIQFFEEILSHIGKKPEECLMVGNDVQEDMIVKQLGMKTYLVEDHMLNRGDGPINVDYKGKYEDFYRFVSELPSLV